ncbi:unnamed protein product, partial [Brenthis ino]
MICWFTFRTALVDPDGSAELVDAATELVDAAAELEVAAAELVDAAAEVVEAADVPGTRDCAVALVSLIHVVFDFCAK